VSPDAAGKKDQNAARRPARKRYDKEVVRVRALELLTIRLGPPKEQGVRAVWDCPACGKREKYSVVKASGNGGCLVAGCRLAGSEDVFAMLAGLEDMDYRSDFPRVMARAYELLGIDPDDYPRPVTGSQKADDNGTARTPATEAKTGPEASPTQRSPVRVTPRARRSERDDERRRIEPSHAGSDSAAELAARVYEKILEICPLETRDRAYLKEQRGVSYLTIKKGRFGTMTAPRARKAKAVLQREFGREQLLKVPGFSEDEKDGRLKWTLTGNFILIPYHDAQGRVTTIEGRVVGEATDRKYVTLRRAGNHLYVFPGYRPEDVVAVCEGAMGAIVAAECGICVGAIMGCERFRASPSPEMLDGAPGDPLLELKGADFGGRVVPYIPDADDPPNPNVLRAAPKAARWISEPQNGRSAICLLPDGMDLDEWLLSLNPRERAPLFAKLLAGAAPPEDGPPPHGPPTAPPAETGDGNVEDTTGSFTHPEPGKAAVNIAPAPIAPDLTEEDVTAKAPSPTKKTTGRRAPRAADPAAQPGLWDETVEAGTADDSDAVGSSEPARRGVSAGARKVRDDVYRALLEKLPPKEEHLAALEKRGVMRATAKVGRFASLDAARARKAVAELTEHFGAKKLLSVPGFEADATGKPRLSPVSRGQTGGDHEYVLLPCFDVEGRLSGVECLPFDHESGKVEAEETVPLKGAGSHLYVFAHYPPGQLEGFCEGPLGAMLAAQEDVILGAIGGFRRYKAASGPGEGRQAVDAVLPELEGVDLAGRQLAYVPRAGVGEANARYHEALAAARWLAERQDGAPAVVGLSGDEQPPEEQPGDAGHAGPASLGEWLLALSGEEAHDRLREIFPQSPVRAGAPQEAEEKDATEDAPTPIRAETPPPLSAKPVVAAVAGAATLGVVLGAMILRLQSFAGYVSTTSSGEPILYSGPLGPLRRLADTTPFHLLYDFYYVAALAAALGLTVFILAKIRTTHLARWRTANLRLAERWELHLIPDGSMPSNALLSWEEALWAVLAWPLGYLISGWLIPALEAGLSLAASLQMAPNIGPLVADPALASIYAATALSAYVLWRRRSMRAAEARMRAGKIRH